MTTLAENFANRLIAGLGVKPEQIRDGVAGFLRDTSTVAQEVLAAKQGFTDAIGHFNARLDIIEGNQRAIMAALALTPNEPNPLICLNGDGHGTPDDARSDSP